MLEMPEYGAIHSHILQDVLARLDKTSQAFFRRVRRGEKAGFPRFKGRNRFHAFTCKEFGNGARLDNGSLMLSKIGRIAVQWSRPIDGTPKTSTISKEADGWYVAISCADAPTHPLPPSGQETGIDRGGESFATLADGPQVLPPGDYRRAQRHWAKRQRRVSRRKKGSHRRRKAICVLAKAHQTVRRQRTDVHHKPALALVRHDDTISHEDVRVRNLVRTHSLAKSLSRCWLECVPRHPELQGCKAARAGRSVVAVDPAYTAQVPRKPVAVAASSCRKVCPSAGTPARTAG